MIVIRSAAGAILLSSILALPVVSVVGAQDQPPPARLRMAEAKKAAPPSDAQPTLLGRFGDWEAYTASPGGKKICFAISRPKSSRTEPANRQRDPAWFFIATRPAENVKNEVSVIIGYPFKANTDAAIEIGSTRFAMYTQNDGAWVKNVAEEARLLDTMRRGGDMTIRGTSGRGTNSIDQFSLRGLGEAMQRVEQECK
jgi:invasion protein IalB